MCGCIGVLADCRCDCITLFQAASLEDDVAPSTDNKLLFGMRDVYKGPVKVPTPSFTSSSHSSTSSSSSKSSGRGSSSTSGGSSRGGSSGGGGGGGGKKVGIAVRTDETRRAADTLNLDEFLAVASASEMRKLGSK